MGKKDPESNKSKEMVSVASLCLWRRTYFLPWFTGFPVFRIHPFLSSLGPYFSMGSFSKRKTKNITMFLSLGNCDMMTLLIFFFPSILFLEGAV